MSPDSSTPGPAAQAGLTANIRDIALALGFARVGFAPPDRFGVAAERLASWLGRGYQGTLGYLEGSEDRADPKRLLPGVKTIVVVALSYAPGGGGAALKRSRDGAPLTGVVARYARGEDYHLVMKRKLEELRRECARLVGREVEARVCVDTAPLLEHEAARLAGIGFSAKSTLTIAPGVGSFVLLGELLLDIELELSQPIASGCGGCTACLDACPTGAFVGPHVLDARRCISYLTIENEGPIPEELREAIGLRVFGCDVCQEVCPFNASPSIGTGAPELAARAELDSVDLVSMLELRGARYRKLVARTALRRAKASTLARNAAVALGNCDDARAAEPLARALRDNPSPLVRGHAAWALGKLALRVTLPRAFDARAALEAATRDQDDSVRAEARRALGALGALSPPTTAEPG